MKYHQYKNYEDYVFKQTKYNKRKEDWIWVWEETINRICEDYGDDASFILCHGTRNGAEQRYFKNNFPNAEVIGTEISDTATSYEMTVQHDFMIQNEEWVGKADIVYSNSIDHTTDIHKTLQVWKDQLSENGTLYIEVGHQVWGGTPSSSDPLSITEEEFNEVIYANRLKIELWWDTEALHHRPRSPVSSEEFTARARVFALTPY